MNIDFTGKRALVTGGATGIGKTIVIYLLKCGASVITFDISKQNLDQLKREYPAVQTVLVDLRDWKATEVALKSVSPIDLLVNNAGIITSAAAIDETEENVSINLDVHLKSAVNATKYLVRSVSERNVPGAIVNICSIASRVWIWHGAAIYSAAKGALESYTRAVAAELGPMGVRVNAVHPTFIKTNLTKQMLTPENVDKIIKETPLGRLPDTEDVANAVLFLLSDKAKMITGASLFVDGGYLCR